MSKSGRSRVRTVGRCALEPLKQTMPGYWKKNPSIKISAIQVLAIQFAAIKLLAITFLAFLEAGRLEQ